MSIQCIKIFEGKITIYELTDGPWRFEKFLKNLKGSQKECQDIILGRLASVAENGIPQDIYRCKQFKGRPGIWEFILDKIDVRVIWISEELEIGQVKDVYLFNGAFKRKEKLSSDLLDNAQKLRKKFIEAKLGGTLETIEED